MSSPLAKVLKAMDFAENEARTRRNSISVVSSVLRNFKLRRRIVKPIPGVPSLKCVCDAFDAEMPEGVKKHLQKHDRKLTTAYNQRLSTAERWSELWDRDVLGYIDCFYQLRKLMREYNGVHARASARKRRQEASDAAPSRKRRAGKKKRRVVCLDVPAPAATVLNGAVTQGATHVPARDCAAPR